MHKTKPSPLLDALKSHTLLCDGAMGSQVQAMDLSVEVDYLNCENCTEILNTSRPDLVKQIHHSYLEAGADCIQTNSFGSSTITLGEFGLQDDAFELSRLAGVLARECVSEATQKDGKTRYVLGSIGPGTKLPSLGHIGYHDLLAGIKTQAQGLLAGGIDAFLIETCQDTLQIKAAVEACKQARLEQGGEGYIPIFVQVTVETTGTLLVGADINAVMAILSSLDVDALGMNCATGPVEMETHLQQLAEGWEKLIFIQPNAGLPCLKHGKTHYDLTPEQLATHLKTFIDKYKLNLIGGCCGTTPSHIRALDAMLSSLTPALSQREREQGDPHPNPLPKGEGVKRPPFQARTVETIPQVASLYSAVDLRQENAYFAIGERCNANGSKAFREAQAQEDWDTCLSIAVEQEREGSHALDVCTAYVGRNEVADMTAFLTRLRGSSTLPLVIDSTELPVLESALALYGGKAILNSINFEDGEAPTHARLKLVKAHGASVIALTIEESGMAKTTEDKVRVAKRLIDFCVDEYGLPHHDILIDPLTFTICTGNEDDRPLGYYTLDAIEQLSQLYPEIQIILGLSNISFGLNPTARKVLNSVYLHEAVKRGMTGAIVHVSKIMPFHKIDEIQRETALDLIYDRNHEKGNPLQRYLELFSNMQSSGIKKDPLAHLPEAIEARLKQRIIDGVKIDLAKDLETAMLTYTPLDIINTLLLDGMKVVGELFGSGQMQLPFVLQSAETMKAAVAYLEPFMEKIDGQEKGTVVLATVKGDVHDIGKNLVDIILTNNGYKVHNLGIKQPLEDILKSVELHKPNAIGLSGLLVKSTVIMRENMIALKEKGYRLPVFLGGAALTRHYVEVDCYDEYPHVAYVKDAFESLAMMQKIGENTFESYVQERYSSYALEEVPHPSPLPKGEGAEDIPPPSLLPNGGGTEKTLTPTLSQRERELSTPPPQKAVEAGLYLGDAVAPLLTPTIAELLPYVDLKTLATRNWGFAPPEAGESESAWRKRLALDAILHRTLNHPDVEKALKPHAVWGLVQAKGVLEPSAPLFLQGRGQGEGNHQLQWGQSLLPTSSLREEGQGNPLPKGEGVNPLLALYRSPTHDEPFATWETPIAPLWGKDESLSLVEGVSAEGDPLAIFAVTLGEDIADLARVWFKEDRYQDYLFLHGVLGELTQAMIRWLKADVILPYGAETPSIHLGAGASHLPDLRTQVAILEALQTDRLGLHFVEEGLTLSHEDASTGLVLWNPILASVGW
jgi:5-methyltetrahydrofolate--homocysteine methyltransferase